MDTYKIDWLKIAKRLSPYNIKKGLLYMKHLDRRSSGFA